MYENNYMYAVERNDEYLAHYGIRGMKWGVRKAIQRGNDRALSKQYAKAQKKLAKLEKRAAKSGKYARRAALMGTGAAVAGGVAAAGVSKFTQGAMRGAGTATRTVGAGMMKVGNAISKSAPLSKNPKLWKLGQNMQTAGIKVRAAGGKVNDASKTTGKAISSWEGKTNLSKNAGKALENFGDKTLKGAREAARNSSINIVKNNAGKIGSTSKKAGMKLGNSGVTNGTLARIGAGAVGAGLAVGAAHNAYRAATAQKKAAKFKSEMNKAFAGTKYGKRGNRQGKKRGGR